MVTGCGPDEEALVLLLQPAKPKTVAENTNITAKVFANLVREQDILYSPPFISSFPQLNGLTILTHFTMEQSTIMEIRVAIVQALGDFLLHSASRY
jgi:hypothetical protein